MARRRLSLRGGKHVARVVETREIEKTTGTHRTENRRRPVLSRDRRRCSHRRRIIKGGSVALVRFTPTGSSALSFSIYLERRVCDSTNENEHGEERKKLNRGGDEYCRYRHRDREEESFAKMPSQLSRENIRVSNEY